MLNHLSIKAKILLLSITIIFIAFIIGAIGIIGIVFVDNEYSYMGKTADVRLSLSNELQKTFDDIRESTSLIVNFGAVYNDNSKVENYYSNALNELSKVKDIIASYKENLGSDNTVTKENKDRLNNNAEFILANLGDEYKSTVDNLYNSIKSGSVSNAKNIFISIGEKNNDIEAVIDDMVDAANDKKDVMQSDSSTVANTTWIAILIIMFIGLIICIVAAIAISKKIIKPLKKLMNASEKVSNGDFNIDIRSNERDECARLANDFSVVIDNISNLIDDIKEAVVKFDNGDISFELDENRYNGEYKNLMLSVKNMMISFMEQNNSIVTAVEAYGKGNFDYTAPRFKGEKAIVHESLDKLKSNLIKISDSIKSKITDVANGNLDDFLNPSDFDGDWSKIISGLNKLIESVSTPIREIISMLNTMAAADFSKRIDENLYKGDFNTIARTVNICCSTLSEYVRETSDVLDKIAHQDISVQVSDRFAGDFIDIKTSLELLLENFNILIKDISASSEQVALGSKSIADSSLTLAQGATEQANAVDELNATITDVAERTSLNAEKSNLASSLAIEAQNNAAVVNKEMKEMLVAMDEINQASNNISNIIKAIDDIAFQTNILALNAAVEAARAGEHGKGFAVVADEVRTLASRSQQSAKETSDLIGTSLEKVEQGMNIANSTAEALKAIINQIGKISEISSEVAEASEKQNVAIKEVNIGITQISQVVSNNTATSEESAAASEQLASQSTLFRESMKKFKLK